MGVAQMITQVVSLSILKARFVFSSKTYFGLYIIDVFNKNKIILAPNAAYGTAGAYFLGRPWRGKREQDSNTGSTHELTP
jgi:hypothetical protein